MAEREGRSETPEPIPADTTATFDDVGLPAATTEERLEDIERGQEKLNCLQGETAQLRSSLHQTQLGLGQTQTELQRTRKELGKLRSQMNSRDMDLAPNTDSSSKSGGRNRKTSASGATLEQQQVDRQLDMIWKHQERDRECLDRLEYEVADIKGSIKAMEKAIAAIFQLMSTDKPEEQEPEKQKRKGFLARFKKTEKTTELSIGGPTSATRTAHLTVKDLGDMPIAELCAVLGGETPAFVRKSVNTDREAENRASGGGQKGSSDPTGNTSSLRRRRRVEKRRQALSEPMASTSSSSCDPLPQHREEWQDEPHPGSDSYSDDESCHL